MQGERRVDRRRQKCRRAGRCPSPLRLLAPELLDVSVERPVAQRVCGWDVAHPEHRADAFRPGEAVEQLAIDPQGAVVGDREVDIAISDDVRTARRAAEEAAHHLVDRIEILGTRDPRSGHDGDPRPPQCMQIVDQPGVVAAVVADNQLQRAGQPTVRLDHRGQRVGSVVGDDENRDLPLRDLAPRGAIVKLAPPVIDNHRRQSTLAPTGRARTAVVTAGRPAKCAARGPSIIPREGGTGRASRESRRCARARERSPAGSRRVRA